MLSRNMWTMVYKHPTYDGSLNLLLSGKFTKMEGLLHMQIFSEWHRMLQDLQKGQPSCDEEYLRQPVLYSSPFIFKICQVLGPQLGWEPA